MPPRVNKRVGFVYIGSLMFRGRLLKQLRTLRSHGFDAHLVHGNFGGDQSVVLPPAVQITSLRMTRRKFKWMSLLSQIHFCRRAARILIGMELDAVVCVGLESLLAGVWVKKKGPQVRLVFDNNELSIESYPHRIKKAIWRRIQKLALKQCNVILHAEANRLEYFRQTYPSANAKHALIENYPRFEEGVKTRTPERPLRVIYLGVLGEARCCTEVVDAFARIRDDVRLDLVGFGPDAYVSRLKKAIAADKHNRIRLLPPIAYSDIPRVLKEYHIGLAFYSRVNLNNFYCAPNKVYDYIANGLPVISNRYPGLVPVLEGNQVGCCIDDIDTQALQSAIEHIITHDYFRNISEALRQRYSWERQEQRYLSLFA